MITRADVADLHHGDVVELTDKRWPGVVIRGPLVVDADGDVMLASHIIRGEDGDTFNGATRTLTIISRAPRPLYVNHPRTEPVPGDVVRDADRDGGQVWLHADPTDPPEAWVSAGEGFWASRNELPARLRLLVDGETGRCVP